MFIEQHLKLVNINVNIIILTEKCHRCLLVILLSLSIIKRSCILSAPFVYFLKDPSSNACSSNEGCFSHRGAYYGTAQYIVFCLSLIIFTSSFLDMEKPKFFHASHLKVTGESIPNCATQSSQTTCDISRFCSTKDDGHAWANGKCSSHFPLSALLWLRKLLFSHKSRR